MIQNFFDEQTDQSEVKAELVASYFPLYMAVIANAQAKYGGDRVNYIDLFAGPGRYVNGAKSTPIKIVEQAIADPKIRQRLVATFNDKDEKNVLQLETALKDLVGYDTLKYPPLVYHGEVDEALVRQLEQTKHDPTLFFVDPWGYKGMTLRLINSVLKHWGCDCFFFFNYSRVNAGISNPAVAPHMDALFGKHHADSLRRRFADETLSSSEREAYIVEEMTLALNEMGGKFVLPFRFRSSRGTRPTHHLFFVSKHFKAYELMKDIMRKHCTASEHGQVNFEYSPASAKQPGIFGYMAGIETLGPLLLRDFAGKTANLDEIYERHSVGKPFVRQEYHQILLGLEDEGAVYMTDPTPGKQKRRKGTLAPRIKITFKQAE